MDPRFTKRFLTGLTAGFALFAFTETASAQELYVTGPLAGAPAVRKLRLYRQSRFELAPAVSFSLLDEYQRTIFVGARLNYNFTDWLAIGAWGAFGGLRITTGLSDDIQSVNELRTTQYNEAVEARNNGAPLPDDASRRLAKRLTEVNLGPDFEDQIGKIDWVVAPQLTVTPFRGKLALFQSVYVDTDLYFFGGPAFLGLTERENCESNCRNAFGTATRTAIAPTFGAGLTFYLSKWSALGWEYRGIPFSWNAGGFDTAGGGKDQEFPDNKITDADQRFHMHHMMTVSFNIYLPTQYKVSE